MTVSNGRVAVVTGGSAGVGRATAERFARQGWDVGLVARGQDRLDAAAAELRRHGARVCAVSADVADAAAVEAAAERIEGELGPIDVWVNNAMATVFAPVADVSLEEVLRGTQVTYMGQVHGTMSALRRMRPRDRGTIVNVGSALAYRAIPLQSIYCGAKYAVRGFTDSLRSELIHDGSRVHVTLVHLPAVNTPQFDWARNKTGRRVQPVPPIYQPEVPARAIVYAATHRRREVWVGYSTVGTILGSKLAPGALADRLAALGGYGGQVTDQPAPADAPGNLFAPVPGRWGAQGRFGDKARAANWELLASTHRGWVGTGLLALGIAAVAAVRRGRRRPR